MKGLKTLWITKTFLGDISRLIRMKMKIYALIGESGTGKSYHALNIANQYQIDYIIDDGLLIAKGKMIAGKSAKDEATFLAATKRAIFHYPNHAKAVSKVIQAHRPARILIVGTSEKMIDKICQHLALGGITKKLFIEEIIGESKVQIAKKIRAGHHTHTVPISNLKDETQKNVHLLNNPSNGAKKRVVRPIFRHFK